MANPHVDNQLIDLLYGELDAKTTQRVEAHMASCVACREQFASLSSTRHAVHEALGDERPSPTTTANILRQARLTAAAMQAKREARAGIWFPSFAVAALIVVLGLGTWMLLRSPMQSSPYTMTPDERVVARGAETGQPAPDEMARHLESAPAPATEPTDGPSTELMDDEPQRFKNAPAGAKLAEEAEKELPSELGDAEPDPAPAPAADLDRTASGAQKASGAGKGALASGRKFESKTQSQLKADDQSKSPVTSKSADARGQATTTRDAPAKLARAEAADAQAAPMPAKQAPVNQEKKANSAFGDDNVARVAQSRAGGAAAGSADGSRFDQEAVAQPSAGLHNMMPYDVQQSAEPAPEVVAQALDGAGYRRESQSTSSGVEGSISATSSSLDSLSMNTGNAAANSVQAGDYGSGSLGSIAGDAEDMFAQVPSSTDPVALGVAYYRDGQYDIAAGVLSDALNAGTGDQVMALYYRGLVYQKTGQHLLAIADLRSIVDQHSSSALFDDAQFALASSLVAINSYDSAREQYEKLAASGSTLADEARTELDALEAIKGGGGAQDDTAAARKSKKKAGKMRSSKKDSAKPSSMENRMEFDDAAESVTY